LFGLLSSANLYHDKVYLTKILYAKHTSTTSGIDRVIYASTKIGHIALLNKMKKVIMEAVDQKKLSYCVIGKA